MINKYVKYVQMMNHDITSILIKVGLEGITECECQNGLTDSLPTCSVLEISRSMNSHGPGREERGETTSLAQDLVQLAPSTEKLDWWLLPIH